MKPEIECGNCGTPIKLIWGGDDIKWTGRCETCGTIVQFVTKEDFKEEMKK